MRLRAAKVWVMQDHSFANVVFADSAEDPAAYIVVTRTFAPSAIQHRLGMDGVYVEVDDDRCAAFRAATGYSLKGTELRIIVASTAFEQLGVKGDLWIELAEPSLNSATLRTALTAIFATRPEPASPER